MEVGVGGGGTGLRREWVEVGVDGSGSGWKEKCGGKWKCDE